MYSRAVHRAAANKGNRGDFQSARAAYIPKIKAYRATTKATPAMLTRPSARFRPP